MRGGGTATTTGAVTWRRTTALTIASIGLALCLAGAAQAKPKPVVSWSLPHTTDAGSPIHFSWSARDIEGARLVIQHPVGTAHTWRTVVRLSGKNGSGELPGLTLGKYRYRLAALDGRRVLTKQAAGVAVFGEVPLTTLFARQTATATFPTFTFPYVVWWSTENGFSNPIFQVEENNCSSAHVAFVPSKTTTGSITLVQESREAITASAVDNAIGSLDAELTPGQSWAVNAGGNEDIHLNGFAVCDSTTASAR